MTTNLPISLITNKFNYVDALSRTFQALADPTRRAILARLMSGEASVGELAEPFAMTLPAVSKHLKVLERAGLISRGRDAQYRPARLESQGLRSVDAWIEAYRRLWSDRLEEHLRALQGEGTPRAGGGSSQSGA